MSNSYKKTPICGFASGKGQKAYRSQENRAKRCRVRVLLHTEQYDAMPDENEYGNEWSSPRDGRQYFGDWDPEDPEEFKKLMRK